MSKFAKKILEFNSKKCPEKILHSERACSIYKFLEDSNSVFNQKYKFKIIKCQNLRNVFLKNRSRNRGVNLLYIEGQL